MVSFSQKRAFSLPEIIIAMAIMGVLGAISFASFSSFSKKDTLDSAVRSIVINLRDARNKTMASIADSRYGVRVGVSEVTVFQGNSFSEATSSLNQVYLLSPIVMASSSSQDFIFDRVTGNSSASGTIDVYLASDPLTEKIIQVHGTGLVDIQ